MAIYLVMTLGTFACILAMRRSEGYVETIEDLAGLGRTAPGMAFVLVPHLDPDHESLLTEILQRITPMPVVQVYDQLRVEPNHVYIIPPNREMGILNGTLQLSVPVEARGQRLLIDVFLRALADALKVSVGFDSFAALRAAMIAAVPALGTEGLADYGALPTGVSGKAAGVIAYPIADFYLTNPIARASETMQRCSAELLHGETFAEAAE
jgi:hypothetical protein